MNRRCWKLFIIGLLACMLMVTTPVLADEAEESASVSENEISISGEQTNLQEEQEVEAETAEVEKQVKADNGITYKLYDNGHMTIGGTSSDGKVVPIVEMFTSEECEKIRTVSLSAKNVTNVDKLFRSDKFWYMDNTLSNKHLPGGYASIYCYTLSGIEEINLLNFDFSHVTSMESMFAHCTGLKKIRFGTVDTSHVTNMSYLFWNCAHLTELNLQGFDTSQVTDMKYMFDGSMSLRTLDVSGFDTSRVTDMSYMFGDCFVINDVDVSGFDTSKITDMKCMFYRCFDLDQINVSGFDTSHVTNMYRMFAYCDSVSALDLSGFQTENVSGMSEMFYACTQLDRLDLSSFDFSRTESASRLARQCDNLEEAILGDANAQQSINFESAFYQCGKLKRVSFSDKCRIKPRDMDSWFSGCEALEEVKLGGVDLSEAKAAYEVFRDCKSLKTLDLSNCKADKLTSLTRMFLGCTSLKRIDLSGFNLQKISYVENLFDGCTSLREIKAPYNCSISINLPADSDWVYYDADGKSLTTLDCSAKQSKTYQAVLSVKPEDLTADVKTAKLEYSPAGPCPQLLVYHKDTLLVEGEDYQADLQNPSTIGKTVVLIKGTHGYLFETSVTVEIVRADLAKGSSVVINGPVRAENNQLSVTLSVQKDGALLTQGKDYTVKIAADSANRFCATVTGIGNYVGEKSVYFESELQNVTSAAPQVVLPDQPKASAKFVKVTDKKSKKKKLAIKISWKKVSGATGYDIYLYTKKKGTYKKVASVSGKKKSATIQKYGKKSIQKKTYYYYVVAKKKVDQKMVRSKVKKKYKLK